jgi:hypothetical protein
VTAKLAGVGFTLAKTEEGREREKGKKRKRYCPCYEKDKKIQAIPAVDTVVRFWSCSF